jgi:AcrR family transcriptional regulator
MARITRNDWLAGAFAALAEGGIDALRVESLAERLGVTKGSFYHHFADRRALHMAMLDEWERAGTDQIIRDVDQASIDPVERVRALAHRTLTTDPTADSIENAIRAWAAIDPTVEAATTRVDDRRIKYTVALLRSTGLTAAIAQRRARLLYRLLIGEYFWRASGAPPITAREIDEVVELLVVESRSRQ